MLPQVRSPEKTAGGRPISDLNLSFRRSNASLSALFAATTAGLPKRASSPAVGISQASGARDGPFRSSSPSQAPENADVYRDTIVRSLVPHITVFASTDAEELLAQKGFTGGILELLRPYGENVQGKVTIRDSAGASKTYEDYAVRFTKLKDGLESPRMPASEDEEPVATKSINGYLDQMFPHLSSRLRTGGDIDYVEQTVEKHIQYSDLPPQPKAASKADPFDATPVEKLASPFHLLYLRRLLSGLPVSPHESFSHPVACVVVISSRNQDPIDELRNLYAATTTGEHKMPAYVNNDYLRYYVLIHDEEHDDVQRSTSLFEQMKRHFGLHCHLLRIRSTQCVPSDDDAVRLPVCEWLSAAEELSEIQRRETLQDHEETGPCLYESDAAAVKSMIRELVTQSIVPMLERQCASWNDQIVTRRRGISGRFLSLSKKWTPFGSSSSRSSSPSGPTSNANYDSQNGFYRPETEAALLRRLGDSCVMLRDFKLAHTAYDLLRTDNASDKAWKHYAGACEMTAITSLLNGDPLTSGKAKANDPTALDALLDAALYQYLTRCNSPYYALRALAVAVELLHARGTTAADDAARWACKIIESRLVGPVGTVLFAERVAMCFAARPGTGSRHWGSRARKAALWSVIAAQRWVELGQPARAAQCAAQAWRLYAATPKDVASFKFEGMRIVLAELDTVVADGDLLGDPAIVPDDDDAVETTEEVHLMPESPTTTTAHRRAALEQTAAKLDEPAMPARKKSLAEESSPVNDKVDIRQHRLSLIGVPTAPGAAAGGASRTATGNGAGDPLGVQDPEQSQ